MAGTYGDATQRLVVGHQRERCRPEYRRDRGSGGTAEDQRTQGRVLVTSANVFLVEPPYLPLFAAPFPHVWQDHPNTPPPSTDKNFPSSLTSPFHTNDCPVP